MVLQSLFATGFLDQAVTFTKDYSVAITAGALVLPVFLWAIRSPKDSATHTAAREPALLPGLPIIGNTLDVLRNRADRHNWFTSLCEQYGGTPYQFKMLGRPPVAVIYTVDAVEDCLKTSFEKIPKGPVNCDTLRDVMGYGIFAVDGPQWVHQRKTASNLFTTRALRDTMTESMRRYAVVLQGILQRAADDHATMDVFKLMNAFTIEAFAKMGFGIEMNCLGAEKEHPFQSAFDSSQRILVERAQRPVWFWKLQRLLNIGNEAQMQKDIAVIDETVMKIIAGSLERRNERQAEDGPSTNDSSDIVSLFLDRFDGSNGETFDPVYLRDIVVNFLIAGRDTTAQAMSWCFYNLSQHPRVVTKIREELARVVPEFASGRDPQPPTMEQVQQLVYLDAVLKETLRLHPSVPSIPKSVAEDTFLSDGTLLRRGTILLISVYAMARMKFIWGPDAKQFKPERWINAETGKIDSVSPFQFASFNAGPRMCLGMNLAMLEMKIVMASVLNRFNIELLAPESITYDNSLTLAVRGPMLARVTPQKMQ